MDGSRRRTRQVLAVLVGLAVAAVLAIPALGAQNKELTVVPGSAAGLRLDGLTYAQAKQRLDELSTITLPVAIAGLEQIGVSGVDLDADDDVHALTLAGAATLSGQRFDLSVTATWPDEEATAPEITIAAETDDVSLSDLNPAWDDGYGDVRFEHAELAVSTTDPRVNFAGRLALSGRLAEAFGYAGYAGAVDLEGSLGADASALSGRSTAGLRLQATLGKSPDAPAWLTARTSVYELSTADGVTIDEDLTVTVGGTTNRFQGRVAIPRTGAIEGELRVVGALDAPFGLDAIENLTLRLARGGGGLAFDVDVDGRPVHVSATMDGTLSIDGSIPAQKLAALGGELLGTPVEAVPGAEDITLDGVSITVARGLFSAGGTATVKGMHAEAVLTLRSGRPLLGLRLTDVRMASLLPQAGGALGGLELPELALVATTLPGVEEPTAQEQAFFGPGSLTFKPGVNVAGRLPLAALGLPSEEEVELRGTLGVGLNAAGNASLRDLELDATLPAATFAGMLPNWVTPTGATTLAFRYATGGQIAASFSTAADVTVGGRSFSTTLGGTLGRAGARTTVGFTGTITRWQHPFGADWLTLDRATVVLDTSFGGGRPATVDASVTAATRLGNRTFALEFGLSRGTSTSATLTAGLQGDIRLGELMNAFPALAGPAADVAANRDLRDLTVVSPRASVTLGGGVSAFELTATTEVRSLTSDLLVSVRPGGGFTFGIKPRGAVDLQQLARVPGLRFKLTSGALVLGSETGTRPVAQLTDGEFDFYKSLYDCPTDAARGDCSAFKTLSLTRGLKLAAGFDLGDDVERMAGAIGIQSSGTALLEGQLPVLGGREISLRASLGNFRFPDQPDWFDYGDVAIEVGADGLHFVGDLGLKIQREGAKWLPRCVDGDVIDGRCYDLLAFRIDAGVKLDPAPALTLSGVLKADKIWRNAFGQDWLQIKRAALQLGVTLRTGPAVTMGFQGDVTIGTKDIAAAVKVGLSPAPPPLVVTPNLIGFSAASTAGIAFSDLVSLNERITGTRLDTRALPDLSLRNLFLQYSQETDADLCLTQGVRFNADLYANGNVPARSADDGDGNGCRTLKVDPETRQSCLDNKAAGCLAGVYGRLDSGGIVAGGELNEFELGPIAFDDTSVRLALTPTRQQLRLKGGVRIGTDGYEFASGRADLDLSRDGFAFSGDAALFDRAFHGYLKATAPFDLTNPSFDVEAWLRADGRGAINTLVGAKADRLRPVIVGLGQLLSVMTGNGSVANIGQLPALLESAGATVPGEVRKMTDALGQAQAKVQEYNLPAFGLSKLLNGFSFGVPGTPGWRHPSTCLLVEQDGQCWTTPPFLGIPGIPGVWVPGACVNYEIDGRCYITKPITVSFGGVCAAVGVPASDCSWSGLMRRYVRPALLAAAERATGIDLDDATFESALSTLVSRFGAGAGSIVNVECAYFRANATALAQGSVNVTLAAKARLFGHPLEFGSRWDFRAQGGSPDEMVKNLLRSVFSPSSTTCPALPAGHEQVRDDIPSATLRATVAANGIDEGDEARVSATFDATALRYPAVAVRWGDGATTVIEAGESRTVSATRRYADNGNYPVTVAVQDAGGFAQSLPLTVRNAPPALTSLAAEPADEGGVMTLRGVIADPGSEDRHTVRVDWGDGTPVETRGVPRAFALTHRYVDDREARVRVEAIDDDGAAVAREVGVTVRNAAPSRIGLRPLRVVTPQGETGVGELTEGALVTYGIDFTDPGERDPHTIVVDWADGTPVETVRIGAGPRRLELRHRYVDDGTFPVQVTVTDEDGARGAAVESLRVRNAAPELTVKLDGTPSKGEAARVVGMIADAGERDAETVRIDWGAGDVQTLALRPGERTFTAERMFPDAGTYPISLSVDDGSDRSGKTTLTLSVN